jgi:penicillin amidase
LRIQAPQWLPAGYKSYQEVLAAAFEQALREEAPPDVHRWVWGREFPLVIEHPVFRNMPLLSRWSAPGRQEQSGGSYTVKQVGRNFGPSERMTVDFSDFDRSTLSTVTGQSGVLFSPHYMDQWEAWHEGATFELPFSQEAIEKSQAHRLELTPQ